MPQLSPMSWVMVFLLFLVCWISIMVVFWWSARKEYSVCKGVKVGATSKKGVSWGFSGGLGLKK
uniref:ATP synthase F0 subunit 8 n=1 Tax=Parvasolenaia rivularis TaxID=1491190 RepID=A0A3G1FKE2_9BIVA|nr:ATP synthase F0 subunit 8 [Parvasolenaia rivularis]AOW43962.1 ATP synthase F0 subunit 8 [Parvasolenaia rivularis]